MPRLLHVPLPILLPISLALAGCLTHEPSWRVETSPAQPLSAEESQLDDWVNEARELTRQAGDRAAVLAARDAWRHVIELDGSHFEALVEVGDLELLLGAAYSKDRADQRRNYLESLTWSERALYTLPEFRARVDAGEPLWIAVDAVGTDGFMPMIKWVTAVFYLYGDSLSSAGKILNVRWLDRCQLVLRRMTEIDTDWEDGLLQFTWGIFHVALPPTAGGDRERAAQELERAIELDPERLLYRWGRGRYFHYETDDRSGFVEDLEWVEAQAPDSAAGPYAWNVYLQRDARRLLDEVDERFR